MILVLEWLNVLNCYLSLNQIIKRKSSLSNILLSACTILVLPLKEVCCLYFASIANCSFGSLALSCPESQYYSCSLLTFSMCLHCLSSLDVACALEAPLLLFHVFGCAESGFFPNTVELEDVAQRCIWYAPSAAEHPVFGNRLHEIAIKILQKASDVGHWVLSIQCFALEVCSIWTSLLICI